jgi:large subunit ribosomal protein L21
VAKAQVKGIVLKQDRHDKVHGVKLKAKKRYRRFFGHKQPYTEVEIKTITA